MACACKIQIAFNSLKTDIYILVTVRSLLKPSFKWENIYFTIFVISCNFVAFKWPNIHEH